MKKWLLPGYLTALAFLSLNPWFLPSPEPALGTIPWDGVDHAVAYAGLAVLTLFGVREWPRGWQRLLWALVFTLGVGLLYEYCQFWFTTTRNFSYADVYADGVGALLGIVLFWGMGKLWRRAS